jgi:hypothetical protein
LAAWMALTGRPYMSAIVAALSPGPRTYTIFGLGGDGVGACSGGKSCPAATVFAWSCSSSTRLGCRCQRFARRRN